MTFGSPLLLLALLLVPAVLALARWLDRRPTRHPVAFTNLEVLAAAAAGRRRRWPRWIPLALFLLALAAAATALAGPRDYVVQPARGETIVLLVDVSGSMSSTDVRPTRLAAAQQAMDSFIHRLPSGVRLALVEFSSATDVLVAPTGDRVRLRQGINFLAPQGGTAIGEGLATAVRLATASTRNGGSGDGKARAAIILLSDGAQNQGTVTPMQGASLAAQAGIPVDTVALGTSGGVLRIPRVEPGTGGQTQLLPAPPDPVTLAAIANATRGQTFRVQTAAGISDVYRKLGSSIALLHRTRELASWFSGLAALLLLTSLGAGRLLGPRLP